MSEIGHIWYASQLMPEQAPVLVLSQKIKISARVKIAHRLSIQ